jgi:hypothetical protein
MSHVLSDIKRSTDRQRSVKEDKILIEAIAPKIEIGTANGATSPKKLAPPVWISLKTRRVRKYRYSRYLAWKETSKKLV